MKLKISMKNKGVLEEAKRKYKDYDKLLKNIKVGSSNNGNVILT